MVLIIIFLTGFCLVPNTFALNCTNSQVGNCYCDNNQNGDSLYELFCPNITIPKITVKVQPKSFVHVTCQNAATFLDMMENLEDLEIGDIENVKILNCPVPPDPLAVLFTKMGITTLKKIKDLKFSYATRSRDTTQFQGYHLNNLTSLLSLDLSRSTLKRIDKTMFLETTKLRRLDLTNNRGLALEGDCFQHLTELEELNLNNCYIQSFELDTFKDLPNLKRLSLHHNKITKLQSSLFRNQRALVQLSIANNELEELSPGIFDNMENLKSIVLSFNKFRKLPENLFKNNKNLSTLEWIVNGKCLPFINNCPEENIFKLSLPETMFQGSSIQEIKMLWVPIAKIPQTLFKSCDKLMNLTIQNGFINELPNNLFSDTKNIKHIDFSGNNLIKLPDKIFQDLYELSSLRFIKNRITDLNSDQFLDLKNLKVAHFQENRLSNLPRNLFSPTQKLEELDLSKNNLLDDNFIKGSVFEHLKILDLANNNLTYIPQRFKFNFLNAEMINMSYNLVGNKDGIVHSEDINFVKRKDFLFDLSYNKIEHLLFEDRTVPNDDSSSSKETKKLLNLTGNPFECDCKASTLKQKLEGSLGEPFKSMFSLSSHDLQCGPIPHSLSGQSISRLTYSDLSCKFPSAQIDMLCTDNCSCHLNTYYRKTVIDCSNQGMEKFPSTLPLIPNYSDTIELIMANNLIRNLSKAVEGYYNTKIKNNNNYNTITKLSLSNNRIETFHQECLPPNLTEIFLDNNRIKTFQHSDINYFDLMINRTKDSNLTLSNNPYECSCNSRPLYHFVKNRWSNIEDFDNIYLQCDQKPEKLIKANVEEFCVIGLSVLIILIVVILVFFLLGVCVILAFYICYRDTIVIWIYSKSWARIFFVEDIIDKEKPYDAFLSYSQQDADFVEKILLSGLEAPENPDYKYKCLIHTRDWNVGEMIPDQIINSVESSRRTIIVLSEAYIESMWTKLEFRAAHTQALQDKTQRVIIIVLGKLPPTDNMEEDLQKYLNLNTYLDSEDPWFWQKLRYALPHRGKSWSKKRTRRDTDKLELMRSQAEQELSKQSRTPSPKTLDIKHLMPDIEALGNKNVNVMNGQVKPINGINDHANELKKGIANGHSKGHTNAPIHAVGDGGKAVSKIFPGH